MIQLGAGSAVRRQSSPCCPPSTISFNVTTDERAVVQARTIGRSILYKLWIMTLTLPTMLSTRYERSCPEPSRWKLFSGALKSKRDVRRKEKRLRANLYNSNSKSVLRKVISSFFYNWIRYEEYCCEKYWLRILKQIFRERIWEELQPRNW